jgi:hypothetical protein
MKASPTGLSYPEISGILLLQRLWAGQYIVTTDYLRGGADGNDSSSTSSGYSSDNACRALLMLHERMFHL